ncbi:MAG: flippase-like domain-containing protein [Acidobacteria bacterium]|nr:flippase-like domain-containing protein [Acidobacteriota bacterium]
MAGLLIERIRTNPQWRTFSGRAFLENLVSISWGWAVLALAAIYTTYLVRALRWRLLMRPVKRTARLWTIFSATVIGFAAIGIFGRPGEMVRPYLVARKEGVPVSSQMAVWVLERCFDTLTVLVIVAFALSDLEAAGLRSSPTLIRALSVGGSVVAFAALGIVILLVGMRNYADQTAGWVLERLRFLPPARYQWVEHGTQSFLQGSRGVRSLGALGVCSLYSAAQWGLIAFCYAAVFNSFSGGMRLSVSETLIFMGCVMAGSFIQVPGLGGGIQVASVLVLTELFAVKPEAAASISLLIWIYTFLVVVPPAAGLAFYEGWSWSKLWRLEAES